MQKKILARLRKIIALKFTILLNIETKSDDKKKAIKKDDEPLELVYNVISFLAENPEDAFTTKDIAKQLDTDRITVLMILRYQNRKGYVKDIQIDGNNYWQLNEHLDEIISS